MERSAKYSAGTDDAGTEADWLYNVGTDRNGTRGFEIIPLPVNN